MISDQSKLLIDFILCPYKSLLGKRHEPKQRREYHILADRQQDTYEERALGDLTTGYDSKEILQAPESLSRSLRNHHRLILNATCLLVGQEISLPPIEVSDSKDGVQSLTPILFCRSNKVSEVNKLIAVVYSLLLADHVPESIDRARIIYGNDFRVRHVTLRGKNGVTQVTAKARHILDAFVEFIGEDAPPPLLQLNRHCDICEFRQRCRDEAIQKDDLSLLSGLTPPEITQWKDNGVVTTAQLAFKFQPKRYCRPNSVQKKHSQPLQALALKEQTLFVRVAPTLPTSEVAVFLDVEGIPDDNCYYLIGMIQTGSGSFSVKQFWSDSDDNEKAMWQAFAKEMESLPQQVTIFHYGSYERTFIENMLERHGTCGSEGVGRLIESLCDVHRVIRTNVFFPTHSNRLKDIAACLGFTWSGPITTGIESLEWRKEWESSGNHRFKDELFRYNQEDCEALRAVVQCLQSLGRDPNEVTVKVQHTSDLESNSRGGFGKSTFAIPEIHGITKRAYFNYQQERIFIRTSPTLRRRLQRKAKGNTTLRINKQVTCGRPEACPICGSPRMSRKRSDDYKKLVKDLRFSSAGVKRWVTEYSTKRWRCLRCHASFYPHGYPMQKRAYGHGVASWVVHQHVANRMSHQALVDNLNDLFGFEFTVKLPIGAMPEQAFRYRDTEELLLNRLRHSQVIFADETKIQVRGGTGYVWVFSGVEEVVYRFTETREANILEEILDGFQGVIVSDFHGGYDSVPCQQQKCLVHLIRDINDDLLKAPFNEELKAIASRFTKLLKSIVDNIDKFGLKKRHLNKFVKPSCQFQNWIIAQEFRSKHAQRYQKRFRKYGDRLFTFLRHDGVPWNNNIAENAIKLVVSRRRFFGASYSKDGMRDYLRFLSFYQTLRRKGGSLLRFLLSKEVDLLTFLGE